MTDFNYKKYSLENLENWLHDAISSAEATPQEIYDTIKNVVEEEHHYYKQNASRCDELLTLLNRNDGWTYESVMKEKEYYESSMPPWGHSDLEYLANSLLTQDRNSNFPNENTVCDRDDPSPECKKSWNSFWEEDVIKEDKVTKWVLPVQLDGLTGDCYINLPDDLLERAGLKEGDTVEWNDRGDGSFEMRKVNGPE
jgi:hypothetical protein